MVINSNTKISRLLKENDAALDVIAALAKPLEKLRNPILRKLMASRTTIQEAAGIGGCLVEDFFRALRPLGFEIEAEPAVPERKTDKQNQPAVRPAWLTSLAPEQITRFDVRQMLGDGHDPLKEIMGAYQKVQPGTALQIINSFVPTPLLRLLENKGALTHSETIEQRLVHSYFFKPETNKSREKASSSPSADQSPPANGKDLISTADETMFRQQLDSYSPGQIKEIDVRALEMPEPMQAILRELAVLPKTHGLYVHHKRIPVYLLEDLQSSGKYKVWIWPLTESKVDLLLTHNKEAQSGKN